MMYKVKVTEWFLEKMPDGKMPVIMPDGNTKLIGRGEEAITDNLRGIANDPRFEFEEITETKATKITEVKSKFEKFVKEKGEELERE